MRQHGDSCGWHRVRGAGGVVTALEQHQRQRRETVHARTRTGAPSSVYVSRRLACSMGRIVGTSGFVWGRCGVGPNEAAPSASTSTASSVSIVESLCTAFRLRALFFDRFARGSAQKKKPQSDTHMTHRDMNTHT